MTLTARNAYQVGLLTLAVAALPALFLISALVGSHAAAGAAGASPGLWRPVHTVFAIVVATLVAFATGAFGRAVHATATSPVADPGPALAPEPVADPAPPAAAALPARVVADPVIPPAPRVIEPAPPIIPHQPTPAPAVAATPAPEPVVEPAEVLPAGEPVPVPADRRNRFMRPAKRTAARSGNR